MENFVFLGDNIAQSIYFISKKILRNMRKFLSIWILFNAYNLLSYIQLSYALYYACRQSTWPYMRPTINSFFLDDFIAGIRLYSHSEIISFFPKFRSEIPNWTWKKKIADKRWVRFTKIYKILVKRWEVGRYIFCLSREITAKCRTIRSTM